MTEIWKDIPEYEGVYQASNLGNIRSVKTGLLRKQHINKNGYLYICLKGGLGKQGTIRSHRLIAITFIGLDADRKLIDHINGIKTDNRAENLRWVTHKENIQAAWDLGLVDNKGQKHGMSKLTDNDVLEIRRLCKKGIMGKEISKLFGIAPARISDIKNGKAWTHIK